MNDFPSTAPESRRWSLRLVRDLATSADLSNGMHQLVDAGIPVFPCVPGGKRPLTVHGFQDASSDPAVVESWWRRWPDANIGVPTGATSGVDVVDVDVHTRGNGFPAFERARRAGFVDGWSWLVRTPSGGVHAYFPRGNSGEQRSWQSSGEHVDFRGDGGYIIVPPSRIADPKGVGLPYRLIAVAAHDPQSVDAAKLREFLEPPRSVRSPVEVPAPGCRPDKLAAWVASRPEGGRNGGLYWAACRLAEEGHDFHTAASMLSEAAVAAGLPEREAMSTIRSAYRVPPVPGPVKPAGSARAVEAVGL